MVFKKKKLTQDEQDQEEMKAIKKATAVSAPRPAIMEEEDEDEYEPPKKVKKKIRSRYGLVEIPTQTTHVIVDRKTEETYDIMNALVELLNKLEEFE